MRSRAQSFFRTTASSWLRGCMFAFDLAVRGGREWDEDNPALTHPHDSSPREAAALLVPERDQPVRHVVGGNGDAHAVAWKNADVVPLHLARQLCPHPSLVPLELDLVLTAAQSVDHGSFAFDQILSGHRSTARL